MQLSVFPNLADPKLSVTAPANGTARLSPIGVVIASQGPVPPVLSQGAFPPVIARRLRADFPFAPSGVEGVSDRGLPSGEIEPDETKPKSPSDSDKAQPFDLVQSGALVPATATAVPELVQFAPNLRLASPIDVSVDRPQSITDELDPAPTIADSGALPGVGLPRAIGSDEPRPAVRGKWEN